MSKADKMFEELGYEKEIIGNGYVFEKGSGLDEKEIDFITNVETSEKEIWIDDFHIITMQELKAINEKVKELGW